MATSKKSKPTPEYLRTPQTYNWGEFDQWLNAPVAAAPAQEEGPGVMGRVKDLAITGVKGAIGVPEAAVGLADIATGGYAGKLAENVGFRPKEAKDYLDTLYTPQQQAAFRAVQQAANPDDPLLQRIADTGIAAVQNPSTIVHAVGESLPSMGAGGVIARGLMTIAPKVAGWAAAGIGEGAVSAGQTAEQVRQETADGTLSLKQSALAAGSGALTAGLGMVAGKVAAKMGIHDIDTMIAGGSHVAPEVQKGFARRVLEGAFSEGVLEELPQSLQEQVAQNYALGKPLDTGVDQAVVMGLLSGGVMGAGANVMHSKVPEVGPLSRAANLAAGGIPPAGGPSGGAPQGPTPPAPLSTVQEQELKLHANNRAAEIDLKAKGRKGRTITGPDGKPMQEPDVQPQFLTPAEKAERDFLTQAGGDVQALARAYPALVQSLAQPPAPPAESAPAAPVIDGTNLPPLDEEAAIARMDADQRKAYAESRGRSIAADGTEAPVVSGAPRPPEAPTAPTAPTGGAAPRAPEAPTAPVAPPTELTDLPMPDQDDILNPQGQPFKERFAANRRRANLPDAEAYQLVQVQGGYAIRRMPAPAAVEKTNEPDGVEGTSPVAPGSGDGSGAVTGGSSGNLGRGSDGNGGADAIGTGSVGSGEPAVAMGDGSDGTPAVARPGAATAGATIGPTPITVRPGNVPGYTAGDILNPKGDPFKEKAAAQAKSKQYPGSTIAEVAGGWVVKPQPASLGEPLVERQPGGTRGTNAKDILTRTSASANEATDAPKTPEPTSDQAPGAPTAEAETGASTAPTGGADAAGERGAGDVQAPGLTGEPIDSEWTAFSPESGTKGIPRADMPQIAAEHRGAMVQFLKARDIAHEQEADVDPKSLKPTQAEFSPGKVQKARDFEGGNRAILVSSDGHVLDGHHQWMAAVTDGTPLRVIRLDAPIDKLIEEVRQMPSAGTSDGATTGGEQAAAEPAFKVGDLVTFTTNRGATKMRARVIGFRDGSVRIKLVERGDEVLTPPEFLAAREREEKYDGPAEPVTGGATAGEPKPPKVKAEPKPPAPPRPEIEASTPLKPADVKRALDSQDDETKAKFEGAEAKTLDGVPHLIAKTGEVLNFRRNTDTPKKIDVAAGYATPTAEREHIAGNAKAAQAAMARMVEGSDSQGIAEALYEGIREVETDDLPLVFAEDRMIRLPVKLAEREKLDAALKKLKFRVTDRSQETDKSERMVLSAIHFPDKATIGDAGAELDGKMKDKDGKPETPPKDAGVKALDDYLDALRQRHFLDPEANPDGSFASMMFKEALMENIKGPLDYIVPAIQSSHSFGYGMKGRAVIADALKDTVKRATLDRLAGEYVERMKKLQEVLTPAKTTAEAHEAFKAAYLQTNAYSGRVSLNDDGTKLSRISSDSSLPGLVQRYAGIFSNDADTDQTNRVKKKDPDRPPRLDRIVRVGMKDHRAGKNVDEADFLSAFGFAGLEFGNWVNQIERQQNLNLAYDSLMDMADLTGFSPKQVSIASRLGLAIGARGQKITSAAAHFEPGTNVINLTKTHGNGTVGHEWFHGLDHNAGAMQGDNSTAAVAARLAVEKLAENLQHRWKPELVETYLRGLLQDASATNQRNTPPKDAVFNAVRHPPGRYAYGSPATYSEVNSPTRFYQDARAMDTGGEKYWSKPVELLARGFETFIFDKSSGGSPYLVSPTRADGFMTAKNGYKGTPYPTGEERQYVADLYKLFLDQIEPETLALKPFKIKARVVEVEGLGFAVVDQYGANPSNDSYRLKFHPTKEEAEKDRALEDGEDDYLNAERLMVGKVNDEILRVTGRIDAIMEEMGIFRWPEIKNGTMAESMFYHLRQGWWPDNNAALIEYAAKAHRTDKGQIDRLKQKFAQEDFESALGRYATQRVQDMRSQGADDRAIFDYLVALYEKQPNLDVQTGTSMSNQAYSTPVPIGFIAGLLTRVKNSDKLLDPTGGNGLLTVGANPKNVITIELEDRRFKNLGLMQYGKVIQGDAVKKIDTDIRAQEVEVVHANPPFGSLPKNADIASWDGTPYELSKIDHLISAKSLKAMADGGRAVLILGAHPKEGAITSADRVFLNWLYNNYNVADHFEIDGKMYSRQGASWPIRVLVIAGRKESLTFYPMGYQVRRVFTFDQLWSRYDEARANSEQVLVGAGKKPDEAGGGNRQPGAVPGGSGGKAAGPGGNSGDAGGAQNGPVVDGAGRGDAAGNGQPGATGGADAGNGKPGGNGQGGRTVAGGAGQPGGRGGSRIGTAGTDTGGISDLTDDDIERLINEALGGGDKKAPKAPKGSDSPVVGGSTGGMIPLSDGPIIIVGGAPHAPKGGSKPRMGTSILDGIPGLDDLFGELEGALNGDPAPDDTPPDTPPAGPPKERKKRETAIERRERLAAEKQGESSLATQAFMPKNGAPLLLGYTPAPALNGDMLNLLGARQHSTRTLASSIRAALDYQLEQEQNPTAPNEKVSSRVMYSRQLEEDSQYGKVQPIFARIWQVLSTTITDIGKRIQAFAVGVMQKFGATVRPLVSRFIQDVRNEQDTIPDRKQPIKAEAIDNETQVVYRGRSKGDSSGIFVPSKQAAALDRAFDVFEARHGDVDDFVRAELAYDSNEAMYKALGGYQIDGLALALSAMKDGGGFIIGDDTGVGKGRAAAAMIAWASQQGKVPIFFSFKDDLYSAMHDDLEDIGKGNIRVMATNRDAVIQSRDGKVVLKNTAKLAKEQAEHIINTGTLPTGINAILTSYAQVNVPNERRELISRLVRDGKAVLIMDEAHNSAGESNTNEFFMSLLTGQGLFGADAQGDANESPEDWEAPPTAYLSATFSKRAENMPVYVRTNLKHAASTPQELVEVFKGGGEVMQQIASEYLVESGSMIRRERSYAGVKMDYVTDEANAPRDSRAVDKVTQVLRQIVLADRAMVAWTKTGEGRAIIGDLIPPGSSIANVTSQDRRLDKSLFTSVVHNYIGQMLLATKVQKAVELGIAAMNRGEKPVFALQNTMESALSDFADNENLTDGDPIPGFGWQSILKRGVTSAQRITLKSGTGKSALKVRIVVPTNVMPGYLAREFKEAERLIEQFQSDLPGSPIDMLRHEMGSYFVVESADGTTSYTKTPPEGSKSRPLVISEITGREFGVDYSTTPPTYRRREDPSNLDIILGYQGNYSEKNGRAKTVNATIDALILNSSGSTGISLHASVNAQDQRPRHMIVLQPNPDIAVFKQTLGRIHRTGQVEWPFFTVLATGIPAERRLLAVLKKKIGFLFSNTSGGEGSTGVNAVDFINTYGDSITQQYLKDNPEIASFIGVDVNGDTPKADLALTASGRASLLAVDEQQSYFDTIEEQFLQEIEMRNATGTNVLNRRHIDFQADMVGLQTLEEGLDETNRFTASAILGKYKINIVGDIPDAGKVRAALDAALNGRTAEQVVNEIEQSLALAYDEAVSQNRAELAEVQKKLTDPDITEAAKTAFNDQVAHLNTKINGFATRRQTTVYNLKNTYPIGAQFNKIKIGDVDAEGVVIGYVLGKSTAKKGNPFAPSNITIRFQRNVPGAPVGIALSRLEASAGGNGDVSISGRESRWSDRIDDWFSLRSVSGGTEERYIAGGNLLRARASVKGGEVLMHTMKGHTADAPNIQSGILMPKDFQPEANANTDFTIRYPKAGADYVLSVLRAIAMESYKNYGDESYKERADAFAAAARFTVEVPDTTALRRGLIVRGPKDAFRLRANGAELRLTIDQGMKKLVANKELKAITGDMAKKRGDTEFSMENGRYIKEPAQVARLVAILARYSQLVVPEAGAAYAKELQQKHYDADNKTPDDGASSGPSGPSTPAASRSAVRRNPGAGQPAAQVQALVSAITARWKNAPRVVVVQSINDKAIPEAVRKEAAGMNSKGTAGAPEGFYNPEDNTVYLIADKLNGDADTVRVLMHESLGHFGLRGVYGAEFGAMLDRLAVLNSGKVRSAAAQLGFDFEKQSERRMAAEEVLAYMAQNSPELGWVQRAIAAIRTWARDNIPGFSKMGLSDAEIIRDFILPARQFVTGGPDGPGNGSDATDGGDIPMASRPLAAALDSGLNSVRAVKLPAGYMAADFMDGTPGRLHWWHKTVGTMYHLAQKSAPFKRVYDGIQDFLNDVSYYATEAADLAPRILPKLDKFSDVWKSPLSPEDTKAISAPIFEGTLSWGRDTNGKARPIDEIVAELGAQALDDKAHMLLRKNLIDAKVLRMWQGLPMEQYEKIIEGKFEREFLKPGLEFTPAELKEHFKLTDQQVGLYQEFRAATNKSITHLAITSMLKFGGKDVAPIREQVLATNDIEQAGIMLRDHLFELAKTEPGRADAHNDAGNKMVEKMDRAKQLIEKGYAPLSRFGQYTLDVVDEGGERVYFGLFESASERAKMARKMTTQFPSATIKQGTVSEETYKLFAGVNPDTVELLGEMLGLDATGDAEKDKAFQEYLKVAKSSRDSMKRLIKRKGIAGFSEDAGRVLAGFVYSNARQTASNLHMIGIDKSVNEIPQGDGQLQDVAVKLREYVKNPQEEAQAFRAVLFAQYLGGSVASAMVNATQPFAVTFPYLSQFGGIAKAARQMAAAVKDATKGSTGDAALDAALKKAEEEGIVSPQEVHSLMAQAMGRAQLQSGDGTKAGNALASANNGLSKLSLAWGKVFGVAEQFNRRTTFIAAYRTAVAQGMANPAKFAATAIAETQFTYNKGNKPRWSRGLAGSILFTFKQYSVNYIELLVRMGTAGEPGSEERKAGQRAALLALAVLFLLSGADGLPFMEDAQDLIDGALQRLGYNVRTKQAMKELLAKALGHGGAEFVMSGVTGIPGVPIDLSGRLGMGNLIPGTGLLQKKADHSRDLAELAGPAGDLVKRGFTAAEQALSGDVGKAVATIAPGAARNVVKAIDMADTGMYRDEKGRKVIDTTLGEALAKGIGFQPASVKNVQDAGREVQRSKATYQLAATEIREKWALALFEGDKAGLQGARDDLAAWNSRNPDQHMTVNMPSVLRRVHEMRKTKVQRIADTAPKALREQARRQLAEELK